LHILYDRRALPLPGTRIGPYEILAPIGAGGWSRAKPSHSTSPVDRCPLTEALAIAAQIADALTVRATG